MARNRNEFDEFISSIRKNPGAIPYILMMLAAYGGFIALIVIAIITSSAPK